jgi:hypothetical protein
MKKMRIIITMAGKWNLKNKNILDIFLLGNPLSMGVDFLFHKEPIC